MSVNLRTTEVNALVIPRSGKGNWLLAMVLWACSPGSLDDFMVNEENESVPKDGCGKVKGPRELV
jgi:hypothetical protein